MPSHKGFEITGSDVTFLSDQTYDALTILGYQNGVPVYGYYDSLGGVRTLGAHQSLSIP